MITFSDIIKVSDFICFLCCNERIRSGTVRNGNIQVSKIGAISFKTRNPFIRPEKDSHATKMIKKTVMQTSVMLSPTWRIFNSISLALTVSLVIIFLVCFSKAVPSFHTCCGGKSFKLVSFGRIDKPYILAVFSHTVCITGSSDDTVAYV